MAERYNPFEGIPERSHDSIDVNPAIKRLTKTYNSFDYDGLRFEYELANQMEIWASGSDFIMESLQAVSEEYKDISELSDESIHEKINRRIMESLETEREKMEAGEDNEYDKLESAAQDAKIAYRSLVLNKLISIYDIEEDVFYEVDPRIVWQMEDLLAEELYTRICGGRTAFSEIVDRFLETDEDGEGQAEGDKS